MATDPKVLTEIQMAELLAALHMRNTRLDGVDGLVNKIGEVIDEEDVHQVVPALFLVLRVLLKRMPPYMDEVGRENMGRRAGAEMLALAQTVRDTYPGAMPAAHAALLHTLRTTARVGESGEVH